MAGVRKSTKTTVSAESIGVDKKVYDEKVKDLEDKISRLEKSLSEALSSVKDLQTKVDKNLQTAATSTDVVDSGARSAIRTLITMLRSNRRPNMNWPNI